MVYKNLDISGLLGMVGPLIRFARVAIGSIDAGDGISGNMHSRRALRSYV
jgi:hypothetical protein